MLRLSINDLLEAGMKTVQATCSIRGGKEGSVDRLIYNMGRILVAYDEVSGPAERQKFSFASHGQRKPQQEALLREPRSHLS